MAGARADDALLEIHTAAHDLLRAAGALAGGWGLCRVFRVDDRTVALDLRPADGGRGLQLGWLDAAEGLQVALRGDAYAVEFRRTPTAWDVSAPETPAAIIDRAECAAYALIDAPAGVRLAAPPPPPARPPAPAPAGLDFGGHPRTPDDDALLQIYAAAHDLLGAAGVLADDWAVRDVFRADDRTVVLDVGPAAGGPGLQFGWLEAADGARAPLRGDAYAVEFRRAPTAGDSVAVAPPDEVAERAERAAYALIDAPAGVRLAAPAAPPGDAPASLNLGVPGPCGQRCGFCSLYTRGEAVVDADDVYAARFARDLAAAAARGVRVLRLNGIEPLAAPYTLGLLERARALGFEAFEIYSTCLPLADPAFAARFLAAMPARYDVYAPIYGASAAVHDGVTNRPGSFDLLRAALVNLRAGMDGRGRLTLTTVLTRQNAGDLAALREFARSRRLGWRVHLPFPNGLGAADPYCDVVPSMTQALAVAYPPGRRPVVDLPLGEVLPCVALDHQARTGHALLTGARLARRQTAMAGTRNRLLPIVDVNRAGGFVAATVACPHRARCALAPACPGEVYALYAQVHGLGELRPVGGAELATLPDAVDIAASLRAAAAGAASRADAATPDAS